MHIHTCLPFFFRKFERLPFGPPPPPVFFFFFTWESPLAPCCEILEAILLSYCTVCCLCVCVCVCMCARSTFFSILFEHTHLSHRANEEWKFSFDSLFLLLLFSVFIFICVILCFFAAQNSGSFNYCSHATHSRTLQSCHLIASICNRIVTSKVGDTDCRAPSTEDLCYGTVFQNSLICSQWFAGPKTEFWFWFIFSDHE